MYGLWYQRTWLDLLRETIIHAVLTSLYLPAIQIKCVISVIIITLIGLQHLASLFIHPDGFITPHAVLFGALLLATMGYIKHSSVLFFVGTYSVISKYEFIKLLPHDDRVALGSYADILNELLKLAVGTAVWCFFEYMLPFRLLQQHAFKLFGHSPIPSNSNMLANSTSIKSLDAKPQWFSEFKWLYALIYPFLPAFIIAQTGWLQLSAVDPDSNVDTLGNSQWDAGLDLDQYDLYDELELTDIHLSPV